MMNSTFQLRKAIIPVAGLGTRLFPMTHSLPKALFPIVDGNRLIVPLVQVLAEEAIGAGMERVGLIIHPDQRPDFEAYFNGTDPDFLKEADIPAELMRAYEKRMQRLCGRIEFITQREPLGFGHAVYRARAWVGGEPVMLLLGDLLFKSNNNVSCCRQLVKNAVQLKSNVIGLSLFPFDAAKNRGAAAVEPLEKSGQFNITKLVEKPDAETAKNMLASPTDPEKVFCFFGCYIFTPDIFDILGQDIESNTKYRGEFELTEALEKLREKHGCYGVEIDGESLDIGNIADYRNAFASMAME